MVPLALIYRLLVMFLAEYQLFVAQTYRWGRSPSKVMTSALIIVLATQAKQA